MDVSARLVIGIVRAVERGGHDVSQVFDGLSFTRAHLAERGRRVPWADYVELFERLGALAGRDEFLRLCGDFHEQFPELRALAGAVISPSHFARLLCLLSASAFPPVAMRYDVNDERLVLDQVIAKPLRGSALFHEASAVGWSLLPCYLGYPRARYAATFDERASTITVFLPRSRAVPSRVRAEVTRHAGEAVSMLGALLGDAALALDGMFQGARPAPVPPARDVALTRDWRLTPRESEVLALIVEGRSNKEIAAALDCSVRTVEIHVSRVLEKSGCASRAEVSAAYWRHVARPDEGGAA